MKYELAIRNTHTSNIEVCIGNGTCNEIDYAIITKGTKGVIIIKINNKVGCFDNNDFINGIFTVLNYKEYDNNNDAYDKMMKWIGKMCKKTEEGRYFNKINPYNHKIDNTVFNNSIIKIIKK